MADNCLRIRIVWISGIGEAGTAGAQQHFDLLEGFTDLAAWPSSLNLTLQFDEGLSSIIKTPRQQPCNVEEHDWVLHEQARVSI